MLEAEELIKFVRERISAQENYSSKLLELRDKEYPGFKLDETRLVSVVFAKYKSEMGTLSTAQKQIAEELEKFIKPMEQFISVCQREMAPKAEQLHYGWKKYQKLVDDCRALEAKASLKWSLIGNLSVDDEIDQLVSELNVLEIGGKKIPADDFNDLISKLQNNVPSEDIWRLLGTYKDTYNGELLFEYLKKFMTDTEAREFLNYLAVNGYIKPISFSGSSVSQFTTTALYQWKITAAEFPNEPAVKKDRRDATRMSLEAARSAKQVEALRLSLNVQMYEYTSQCQKLMVGHIDQIKIFLLQALEAERLPLKAIQTINENCQVFLESLDAEKSVKAIMERDRTGIKPSNRFI